MQKEHISPANSFQIAQEFVIKNPSLNVEIKQKHLSSLSKLKYIHKKYTRIK